MTNGELVKRFIEYYGGKPGNVGNDITPIAPYILMDLAYQSYRKHIAPLPVRGRAKQLRTYWSSAYHKFNSQIFLPFNTAERDEVIDRMDDIEDYLSEEITELENAITAYLETKNVRNTEVITCAILNNILAQSAQELIRIASTSLTGQPAESRDLDGVRIFCIKFATEYLPPDEYIDTSSDERVNNAVDALSHKIALWIFK